MKTSSLAVLAFAVLAAIPRPVLARMTDTSRLTNSLSVIAPQKAEAALTEPSWIPESALKTVPGSILQKDPQIKNTSRDSVNELVGMRIEFRYSEACPDPEKRGKTVSVQDMQAICKVYTPDYEADRKEGPTIWRRASGESLADPVQHFYYSEILMQNETTVPLFTQIKADPEITAAEFRPIQKAGGFDLIVEGSVLPAYQPGPDAARNACEQGRFIYPSEQNE